jgi:hypothetical protein
MRELLVRGKNTIDPEVIDPGGRSVEDSPVKSDFTFTFCPKHVELVLEINKTVIVAYSWCSILLYLQG